MVRDTTYIECYNLFDKLSRLNCSILDNAQILALLENMKVLQQVSKDVEAKRDALIAECEAIEDEIERNEVFNKKMFEVYSSEIQVIVTPLSCDLIARIANVLSFEMGVALSAYNLFVE